MYEATINLQSNNREYIDFLVNKLHSPLTKVNGVLVVLNRGQTTYLSIACDCKYREEIEDLLKQQVAYVLAVGFKNQYLKDKLIFPNDNLLNRLITKVMSIVDCGIDSKIISNSISTTNKISLEGYYNFKLKQVKLRWDEMINLTTDSGIISSGEDIRLDFLSFLCEAITPIIKTVKLRATIESFTIADMLSNDIEHCKKLFEMDIQEEILYNLIYLGVKKVYFNGDIKSFSQEFIRIFESIFVVKYVEDC